MFEVLNSCDGKYKDSLDVRFTKVCDNNCEFCIEKEGIDGTKTNVDKLIESTIESKKTDILILGGEPCLLIPDLYKYITGIRNHVSNIYITTSLPVTIRYNWNMFIDILDKIDGLNVSLQHYNWEINNEILHAVSRFNRIELLEKICKAGYANKIRVSINLVKGAIDSKHELEKFLDSMENIGVQHVKINELQNSPNLYVSFEAMYDNIELNPPYSCGCQTEIQLPNHNLRITLKRACFKIESSILPTEDELEKYEEFYNKPLNLGYTVVYEDGTLSYGWKQKN